MSHPKHERATRYAWACFKMIAYLLIIFEIYFDFSKFAGSICSSLILTNATCCKILINLLNLFKSCNESIHFPYHHNPHFLFILCIIIFLKGQIIVSINLTSQSFNWSKKIINHSNEDYYWKWYLYLIILVIFYPNLNLADEILY